MSNDFSSLHLMSKSFSREQYAKTAAHDSCYIYLYKILQFIMVSVVWYGIMALDRLLKKGGFFSRIQHANGTTELHVTLSFITHECYRTKLNLQSLYMNAPNHASGYDDVMCITIEDHVFQDLHINIITNEYYMIHVWR